LNKDACLQGTAKVSSTREVLAISKGHVSSHRAYLRVLSDKVSKTHESLERATQAYNESRKLLVDLHKPARFAGAPARPVEDLSRGVSGTDQ